MSGARESAYLLILGGELGIQACADSTGPEAPVDNVPESGVDRVEDELVDVFTKLEAALDDVVPELIQQKGWRVRLQEVDDGFDLKGQVWRGGGLLGPGCGRSQ